MEPMSDKGDYHLSLMRGCIVLVILINYYTKDFYKVGIVSE